MKNQEFTWIHKILRESFESLNHHASITEINYLSELIAEAMAGEKRVFHRSSHLEELVEADDALINIAVLFHDLIYFQVDRGLPPLAMEILRPFLIDIGSNIILAESGAFDPDLAIVYELFQCRAGDSLNPASGMNELLSAMVAFITLPKFLTLPELICVIVCIEATIPFRTEVEGKDPMTALHLRLRNCNSKYGLAMTDKQMIGAVQRAVQLANRDVKNFAADDPAWFIATTWLLLPERNEKLQGSTYNFEDYRSSLEKMDSFFNFLKPELIFKNFEGYPDEEFLVEIRERARMNINLGREYIQIKLVGICLLKALAELSGGDLPISTFLGGGRELGVVNTRMEEYLPLIKSQNTDELIKIFENGLPINPGFDLPHSPLAAYLLRKLGRENIREAFAGAVRYGARQFSAGEYLSTFAESVIIDVARAVGAVCAERRLILEKIPPMVRKNRSAPTS